MGLLDGLMTGKWTGDPERDREISQGLLHFGLNLLSNRGTNAGQAGLAGLQGVQQYRDSQYQAQLRKAQMEEAQRARRLNMENDALRNLPQQFIKPAVTGAVDATGGIETDPMAPNNSSPARMDLQGLSQAYMNAPGGFQSGLALQQALQKQGPQAHNIAKDGRLVFTDPLTGRQLNAIDNPSVPKEDEFITMMRAAGIDPKSPQGQVMLRQLLQKQSTHQPPISIATYGSPVPVQLPNGETALAQPGNRAGAPPQLMTLPGSAVPLKPAKDPNAPMLNDNQSKALLFGSRAKVSDNILNKMTAIGVNTPSLIKQNVERVPLVGEALGYGANMVAASPEQQQVEQAQRDFVNAVLRRESGAVISPSEFENARRQYFPQPGDSKANVDQKSRNRKLAVDGLLIEVPKQQREALTGQADYNDPLGLRK